MVISCLAMVIYSGALRDIDSQWFPLIAIGIICILIAEYWRRNRGLPPGPTGLPFVGYYPFLGSDVRAKLLELSKKYGEIYSFRSLSGDIVIVINGLKLIKEVLVSRSDEFNGRPLQANLIEWIDNGLGIAQTEGDIWKEQRKYFLQAAKQFGFGKMECESVIHENVHQMIDDIRQLNGKSFDPHIHVSHVTANVIGNILFKQNFKKDDPNFLRFADDLKNFVGFFTESRVFLFGTIMKILMKLRTTGRKAYRLKDAVIKQSKENVDAHKATFDSNNLRDFVDSYLDQMNKFEEKGLLEKTSFSRKRLNAVAMNMMMEGTESTSTAIQGLLFKLCQYEEVQKKVQAELDAVIGRNRLPSWSDRQNLPYLEATILELFRFASPFFISTYYSNFEEARIRDYRIPKRSIIVAHLESVSYDPELYPKPNEFRPERFLGPDGKRIKIENPLPFGIGKRTCIGESLAQMDVFNVIAGTVQNFTLYPSTPGQLRAVPREAV